jgi:hypothetical protein
MIRAQEVSLTLIKLFQSAGFLPVAEFSALVSCKNSAQSVLLGPDTVTQN